MRSFHYENKKHAIISNYKFVQRLVMHISIAIIMLALSLFFGMIGYAHYGEMSLLDGFYNASMILTGMGPVNILTQKSAKIFSSLYALYSGITFLSLMALIISPIFHRIMHILHIEEANDEI